MSLSSKRFIEKDIKKKFGELSVYKELYQSYENKPKCNDCYSNNSLCTKCCNALCIEGAKLLIEKYKGEKQNEQ